MYRKVTVVTLIGRDLSLLLYSSVSILNEWKRRETYIILSKEVGFTEYVVCKWSNSIAKHVPYCMFCILIMCFCVCVSLCSLCYAGRGSVWSMLALLLFKPPDEEAFQSDHRIQMLRLAWGNHTKRGWHLRGYHHHWAQSKLFSTPDETSHYWKNAT